MASVFLSYAREDSAAVNSVARALEKRGHDVWWDRHLGAGSEFSQEIEHKLAAADAIVVLWSAHSVRSSWVRDEAEAGRVDGRLVPVCLDGTEPPLGFRQFHTIDLTDWNGRPSSLPAAFADAVAAKASETVGRQVGPTAEGAPKQGRRRRTGAVLWSVAALLAAALVFAVWYGLGSRAGASERPTVAVLPFQDMSPQRDQAHLAEGIAEEILNLLSGDPNLKVIGRTSSWQFRDQQGDLKALRAGLGATHLLEGSVRAYGDRLRISARLLDVGTGQQLWSEVYERGLEDVFEVQEDIGASVVQRMRGTFRARAVSPELRAIRTRPQVYELYLSAKASTRRANYDSALEAQRLLRQALQLDADYAPAHALMVFVHLMLQETRPTGVEQMRPDERRQALYHANRAVQLAPQLSEAHLALGWAAQDIEQKRQALRKAIELDRNNFQAWQALGGLYQRLCKTRDAAESFQRAVAIEPLMMVPHVNLMHAYLDLGRPAEAEDVLTRFASASRIPSDVLIVRTEYSHSTGRPADTVQFARQSLELDPDLPRAKLRAAYGLQALGRTEDAVAMLPTAEKGIVGNYWKQRYDDAAAHAARLGDNVWHMRFVAPAAVKALVHSGNLALLDQLMARRAGSMANFGANGGCELHRYAPSLVVALRKLGRQREADALLKRITAEHRQRVRHGYDGTNRPVISAAIFALSGMQDEALNELERAVARGWVNQGEPYDIGLADPAFDSLRGNSKFIALERRIRGRLAGQAATATRSPSASS